MKVDATPLAGLVVAESAVVADARGRFTRLFCAEDFAAIRPDLRFPQVNLSVTRRRGSVRGLHFQHPPHAEAKLVRCLRGRVFDVAVDLRAGSPTFLRWHAVELSADRPLAMFVPEGFAHGFQALEDDVEMLYMHTHPWHKPAEGRLRFDDPALAIAWPLAVADVSDADRAAAPIGEDFAGVRT